MTAVATRLPGVRFEATRAPAVSLNLRTDVALFVGETERGQLDRAVRVEGWREFAGLYGNLGDVSHTPHAVRGYFDNGGEVAWIWRIGVAPAPTWDVPEEGRSETLGCAGTVWDLGSDAFAARLGLHSARFLVLASSAGIWGDRVRVQIQLQRKPSGPATLDIFVRVGDLASERLIGVPCAELSAVVAQRSRYIRFWIPRNSPQPSAAPAPAGPLTRRWALQLSSGAEPEINRAAYDAALDAVRVLDEPALLALPDLTRSLQNDDERRDIFGAAARDCSDSLDRLLLIDLPEPIERASDADDWLSQFGDRATLARAAAAFHPWITIPFPSSSRPDPTRTLPTSGHVLGVISRLDRERGAGVTPANASLEQAIDLSRAVAEAERAGLHALGINAIVCQSGRGLVVWGGRTLGSKPDSESGAEMGFIAHRRLIHRLVRAVRYIARPLVFENNGPQLWFALTRGATTVLLEAWRTRALKGTRPDEAFRVRCDAELNTPDVIERGRVICEISLAPAVPMEFITVRVALSADGQLEVAEP